MTPQELKEIIARFNEINKGKYEASLYITDLVEQDKRYKAAHEAWLEKTKDNLPMEEIVAKFPLFDFEKTQDTPLEMWEMRNNNRKFLLGISYNDREGTYGVNFTPLHGVMYYEFMDDTFMKEYTCAEIVDYLTRLGGRLAQDSIADL